MKEKKRVLQIFGGIPDGGVATVLKNIALYIDKNKYDIFFLLNENENSNQHTFINFLNNNNLVYMVLPSLKLKNIYLYLKKLSIFYSDNQFDIIHLHSPNLVLFNFIFAKRNNIKVRIVHAHSIKSSNSFFKRIRNKIVMFPLKKLSTHYCACSIESAKKFFKGQDTFIYKNGINTGLFKFNETKRNQIRLELNLSSKIILGHVGRVSIEKNQTFLLDIIKHLPNRYHLLIVGDGELLDDLKSKSKKLKVEEKVTFLGNINNVNEVMQAFDIFLFPSLFEGFPLVLIEAQDCGIPILASNNVSEECKLTKLVKFLSISEVKEWISAIENTDINTNKRITYSQQLVDKGYDVKESVKSLESWYEKICRT